MLRHANSRITLDIYTQVVSSEKALANGRATDLLLVEALSNPHSTLGFGRENRILLKNMVATRSLELLTSTVSTPHLFAIHCKHKALVAP